MGEGRDRWLMSAMLTFCIWSSLMFIVRLSVKINVKRWGTDDYAISAAFIVSLMDVGATIWALQRGYGRPLASIMPSAQIEVAKALFASQQFYVAAMGLCKISSALFLVHLAYPGPQVKPGYFIVGVSAVWAAASMLVVGLRGSAKDPWATLDGSSAMHVRWIAVETSGVLIELLLWGLSIRLVRGLQLNLQKRIIILSAFGVRLLLIPLIVARLYYLSPAYNTDPTYTSIIPNLTTEASLHFSIISASITSLRPFLRSVHLDYDFSSKGVSKHSMRSGDHSRPRDSYYRLDALNTKGKVAVAVETTYPPKAHVQNSDKLRRQNTSKADSQDELVSTGSITSQVSDAPKPETMVIQKTVNWTVEYDKESTT